MRVRQTNLILYTMGIATVLASCGPPLYLPTTPLESWDKPTQTDAYLYGRFEIRTSMDFSMESRSAFVIGCEDGNEYKIPFLPDTHDTTVIAIKIAPSKCALRGFIFVKNDKERVRNDSIGQSTRSVEFAKGTAYYLGDFLVNAGYSGSRLERVADEYEKTTGELKQRLPAFATVPTEKRLLDDTIVPDKSYEQGLADSDRIEKCLKAAEECRNGCGGKEDRQGCLVECKRQEHACK